MKTRIGIGFLKINRYLNEFGYNLKMNRYLVAIPIFRDSKGFNHLTILVRAKDERDALAIVRHLKPGHNIGEIRKQV